MEWAALLVPLTAGFALGVLASLLLRLIQAKTAKELADELYRENEARRKESIDALLTNVKASFGDLSLEALSRSTEAFLRLAKSKLESERAMAARELDVKKGLIDEQLRGMTAELEKVAGLVKELEKDRIEKFGELTNQLKEAREQTALLTRTTGTLREALASTKVRGQWGERMAEDVLRLAGFVENVNYCKQRSMEKTGTRPDFTFLLPRDLQLNMDVKFPLDNYVRHLEASSDSERSKFQSAFLRDVRARIKEVTSREYINREENTLDYVLLFIPNEQIYAFIQEQDRSILDDGLKQGVVLCSPLTLFAVLAVIRQAVENFAVEQASKEILLLLGAFQKQWDAFVIKMDVLGRRISEAQKEYDALVTTRRRQLEKPLTRIGELRTRHGGPEQASRIQGPVEMEADSDP